MVLITSNHIAEFRQRLGMSQKVLASLIGVSKNSISNFECGIYNPSLTNAIDLCIVFKCSLTELFSFSKLSTDTLDHYISTCHEQLSLER